MANERPSCGEGDGEWRRPQSIIMEATLERTDRLDSNTRKGRVANRSCTVMRTENSQLNEKI